jgi:hypothetical protein
MSAWLHGRSCFFDPASRRLGFRVGIKYGRACECRTPPKSQTHYPLENCTCLAGGYAQPCPAVFALAGCASQSSCARRQLPEVPQLVFACCGLALLDFSANSLVSLPAALSELKVRGRRALLQPSPVRAPATRASSHPLSWAKLLLELPLPQIDDPLGAGCCALVRGWAVLVVGRGAHTCSRMTPQSPLGFVRSLHGLPEAPDALSLPSPHRAAAPSGCTHPRVHPPGLPAHQLLTPSSTCRLPPPPLRPPAPLLPQGLTHLDVSFNQLRELPASLGALSSLTCLKASYNQIERLHPQVGLGMGG